MCSPHHRHERIHVLLYDGGRAVRLKPDRDQRPVCPQSGLSRHRAGDGHLHHARNRRQRGYHEKDGRGKAR